MKTKLSRVFVIALALMGQDYAMGMASDHLIESRFMNEGPIPPHSEGDKEKFKALVGGRLELQLPEGRKETDFDSFIPITSSMTEGQKVEEDLDYFFTLETFNLWTPVTVQRFVKYALGMGADIRYYSNFKKAAMTDEWILTSGEVDALLSRYEKKVGRKAWEVENLVKESRGRWAVAKKFIR